ncbi:DUF1878 family protein [Heyndrickxia ginsengihumi]|uniref:DUF1878 family protein n=1 Tax=Heyndrickxia ginsengihumi TaxID=363870 RepID=A0A0A6VE76_9BACI|nr:DUF1878 family protein [Heyndrickxia ginsengihumi]KHD85876.1 hypothetical protein NG54_06380 [Heyndrickxia ginsengihumi]MBE6185639.1 DUF1878 family protein [Bacillus sp. (in: firmicutes)]MCM3023626.1 YhaI family protein [Heyndrickxia ginsengihumi]NEY18891.1 DUF1878 family protein [Heyndrickxia ginsengihumi]
METIEQKLERLEFYQTLLMQMVQANSFPFYKLVMEKQLSKQDMEMFFKRCEALTKELQEQKADQFVFFYPLFQKFKEGLHKKLDAKEVILACKQQHLFPELMKALEKNI